MTLPSGFASIDPIVELFLGGTWVGVSEDLLTQSIPIRRGRPDESSQSEPTTLSLTLDNRHGNFTPGLATGDHYPGIRRGVRCRIRVPGGPDPYSYLVLPGGQGNHASTPNHASLQTTDLDVRAWIDQWFWTNGAIPYPFQPLSYVLASKWQATSDERSWLFWGNAFDAEGQLIVWWSSDGTAPSGGFASSGEPVPIRRGPLAGRVTLDVNNGSGQHVVQFYTGPTLAGPWTPLGDPFIGAGTTSIHPGTAPVCLGGIAEAEPGHTAAQGKGFGLQLMATIGGSPVTSPDFTTLDDEATGLVDAQGRPWSVDGSASVVGVEPARFHGQVDSWRIEWPAGDLSTADDPGEARAHITVSGELRRLSQGRKPLTSALRRSIAVDPNVVAAWPLEDGSDTKIAGSSIPGVGPLTVGGAFTFAGDSTLPGSGPLPSIAGGQSYGWSAKVPPAAHTIWRTDFMLKIPTASASFFTPLVISTSGTIRSLQVAFDPDEVRLIGLDIEGNTLFTDVSALSGFYGGWNRVSVSLDQDGADVGYAMFWYPLGATEPEVGTLGSEPGTVGRITQVGALVPAAPTNGVAFGHLVVAGGAEVFLLGDGIDWLVGADNGYIGELAGDRIARLCTEEGIPIEVLGDTPGEVAMGPQGQLKLLELLQECAAADMGILLDQRDGPGLLYRTRRTLGNQVPIVLNAAANEIAGIEAVTDDQRIRNDVTVSRPDGSSSRQVDEENIAANDGVYDVDVSINVAKDEQLPDQAGWRLHLGTSDAPRYPALPIELATAPDLIPTWHTVDVGQRLQIANLPPQHPSDNVDLLLDGYEEELRRGRWPVRITGSPAGPWDVGVLEDDVLGRADTDGSELHAAVDDNDASFEVAVTDGPMWTTDDAQFPFETRLAGEDVDVTDIAASLVTFGAAGTAAHANNANVTPGLPASTVVGNLLLTLAGIRNSGAGVPNTPTGHVRLPVFAATDNVQLFARVADGTAADTPTISFSGGVANADTSAQMARLGGKWHDAANVLSGVAARSQLNGSAQDIAYPPLVVGEPNCIVLYLGWKQDDWTSVATIGGATEIGEPDTTTGDDQGLVWGYVIQTTPVNIAAGSFVVTGGGVAISRGAVVALRCDRQTWTVTRSMNGVIKSHPAGTPIALATPMVADILT